MRRLTDKEIAVAEAALTSCTARSDSIREIVVDTNIGRGFSRLPRGAVLSVAALTLVADLWLCVHLRWPMGEYSDDWLILQGRWAVALMGLAALLQMGSSDILGVGLAAPRGGWWCWVKLGMWIGLAVAVLIAGWCLFLWASGRTIPIYTQHPAYVGRAFVNACVLAPLLEETIYRMVLYSSIASAIGPRWAIAASGAAFGLLHVVYGSPSPENILGGFFLAWAYLRSGSIYVPLALHAAGNAVVMAGQAAAWYWVNSG